VTGRGEDGTRTRRTARGALEWAARLTDFAELDARIKLAQRASFPESRARRSDTSSAVPKRNLSRSDLIRSTERKSRFNSPETFLACQEESIKLVSKDAVRNSLNWPAQRQ
jgi:hypothetical protein